MYGFTSDHIVDRFVKKVSFPDEGPGKAHYEGFDLGQYLASLERLLALEPRRLYPAHGPVIEDPRAILTQYLAHRRFREQQVLNALRAGQATVETIAESIYDGLAAALVPAARENVRAHLEKLKHEGRVVDADGQWHL